MNGECKSYRLNDPMAWKEFKSMPDDLKITYINLLRKKFNVPGTSIAMATACITILPMVCVFPYFQKYFVKGMAIGAVKM